MIYLKEGTKHIYYCLGVKAIINGRHYINILGNYIWILRLEISFLVLKIIKEKQLLWNSYNMFVKIKSFHTPCHQGEHHGKLKLEFADWKDLLVVSVQMNKVLESLTGLQNRTTQID